MLPSPSSSVAPVDGASTGAAVTVARGVAACSALASFAGGDAGSTCAMRSTESGCAAGRVTSTAGAGDGATGTGEGGAAPAGSSAFDDGDTMATSPADPPTRSRVTK